MRLTRWIILYFILIIAGATAFCSPAAARPPAPGRTHSDRDRAAEEARRAEQVRLAADSIAQAVNAIRQGQRDRAAVHCEEAMRHLPDEPRIMKQCVLVFDQCDKKELAYRTMMRLSEQYPEHRFHAFYEAVLCTEVGRYDEALAAYGRIVDPDVETASGIHGNIAEIHMIRENLPEAIREYEIAIRLYPKNVHAMLGYASALVRAGRSAEARDAFLRGAYIDPNLDFLKSSFFVPEVENDYQRAVLELFSSRPEQARFYLERYVAGEQRRAYRESARVLLDGIGSVPGPRRVGAWPVVVSDIVGMATSGRFIAFVTDDDVWVLDTEMGTARRRIPGVRDFVRIGFDTGSGQFVVVTKDARYSFDPVRSQPLYSYYAEEGMDQAPAVPSPGVETPFPELITTGLAVFGDIMAVSTMGGVSILPVSRPTDGVLARIGRLQNKPFIRVAFTPDGRLLTLCGTLAELWELPPDII